MMSLRKFRVDEIDTAKGIAIILVVIGHIVATDVPEGNQWYHFLKSYIYKFHMPFFIFLAGCTFYISSKNINQIKDLLTFYKKKTFKLIPPYIFFSVSIYFGKIYASTILYVDNLPTKNSLIDMIVYPTHSYSKYLWFIYVLLLFYVVTPPLILLIKNKALLIVISIFIFISNPGLSIFGISSFCFYFIFFISGLLAMPYITTILNMIDRKKYFYIIAFVIISPFMIKIPKVITGFISIIPIFALTKLNFPLKESINYIGQNSFSIYLMNTIVIGLFKGVLLTAFPWHGTNFYYYFCILLIAGIFVPLAIKHYTIKIFPSAKIIIG